MTSECGKLRLTVFFDMSAFHNFSKLLPVACATASLTLAAGSAHAAQSVTFTTTSPAAENNPSKNFLSSPSGVNFTVTNPNSVFDSPGGVNTTSSGLCAWASVGTTGGRCGFNVSDGFSGVELTQLQGTFDKPVILTSFTIGQASAGNTGTTLQFLAGSLSETFNISTTAPQTYSFTTPFQLAAGETLDIFSSGSNTIGTNGGFFRISSLDAVDVPGPLPLLGGAAALGWSRKLRHKIKVSR